MPGRKRTPFLEGKSVGLSHDAHSDLTSKFWDHSDFETVSSHAKWVYDRFATMITAAYDH